MLDDTQEIIEAGGTAPKPNDVMDKIIANRKIICRYGRGCTHIYDPIHKERFWHPPVQQLSHDQIRTNYICYECGNAFMSLSDLQVHLERKTAWTNASLVGCRISCLVDNKEWHEGIVTQYHKSGKHYVELRTMGEKCWITMNKCAFYIIERPFTKEISEFKEEEPLDPSQKERTWTYCEDISMDYAFAQSVLFKIYGTVIQETGHKTRGHVCVTDEDRDNAKNLKGSLLYGELLPRGANKALGSRHLKAASARTLFDLGMGIGKIVIQAFLQFRNLELVYGVELSSGRYNVAEDTALRMVNLLGKEAFVVDCIPGQSITITERASDGDGKSRVLKMERGDMLLVNNIELADIVMLETDVPMDLYENMCNLLTKMKMGARTLTYLDMKKIWPAEVLFPFAQLDINRPITDRFPTSWSVQRGHHFFLWYTTTPYMIPAEEEAERTANGLDENRAENSQQSRAQKKAKRRERKLAALANMQLESSSGSASSGPNAPIDSRGRMISAYPSPIGRSSISQRVFEANRVENGDNDDEEDDDDDELGDDFEEDDNGVHSDRTEAYQNSPSLSLRGVIAYFRRPQRSEPSINGRDVASSGGKPVEKDLDQGASEGSISSLHSPTQLDPSLKTSRCLRFSWRTLFGVDKSKAKNRLKTDYENEKVIPVNSDGSRSSANNGSLERPAPKPVEVNTDGNSNISGTLKLSLAVNDVSLPSPSPLSLPPVVGPAAGATASHDRRATGWKSPRAAKNNNSSAPAPLPLSSSASSSFSPDGQRNRADVDDMQTPIDLRTKRVDLSEEVDFVMSSQGSPHSIAAGGGYNNAEFVSNNGLAAELHNGSEQDQASRPASQGEEPPPSCAIS